MTIKITKLRLKNYRGIAALDVDIGEHGLIARGRNGAGKTTVLRALGAALAASDIGPDAVRIGEEEGEILVDLDRSGAALHVRRRFGAAGSTLQVSNDEGDRKAKPTQVLAELLGTSALDVVSVVLERDRKKRRELILAALPVSVTVEQLRTWVPSLPATYDVAGHGLEVVGRLRASAYEKRTAANKVAEEARLEAARLEAEAKKATEGVEPVKDWSAEAARLASAACGEAARALAALLERKQGAERAAERLGATRAQIATLRADAHELREGAFEPPAGEGYRLAQELALADQAVRDLEEALRAARVRAADSAKRVEEHHALVRAFNATSASAADLSQRAKDLEDGIAAAIEVVDPKEIEAARERVATLDAELVASERGAAAAAAESAAEGARQRRDAAAAEAARLDAVVKSLTVDAPAAILAASGVPQGLEIDGTEIRLNGVDLDKLCGKEQVVFAADIARALNPGAGFLVVDGLERLDPEQLDAFVEAVTADGRQLIGSLVARGDLELVAIERSEGT
jgi:AAA domain